MSRQQFTSRNDKGQILTFQKSGSTASFDPTVTFSSGSKRVSWRLNNGSGTTQIAGNSLSYTGFTSDTNIRTVQMRGNSFKNINLINFIDDNIYGNLDLTPLSGLGGSFQVGSNPQLTGVTHSPSSVNFSQYLVSNCNLIGNLDLTPLSGLGGNFGFTNNPQLTGITHSPSSQNFSTYFAGNCNLTGNLDLTPLSGLGGNVIFSNNPQLTGITHSPSSVNFTAYAANDCNLLGTLDLRPLSKLGTAITLKSNSGLTNVLFTANTQNIIQLDINDCNLTGTIDLSPLTKLGGSSSAATYTLISLTSNPNLTNILLPNSNQYFINLFNAENSGIFGFYDCNLDYVDFTPLSGATFLTGTTQGNPRISLRDNGMSTTHVNHILVDFSGNATYNPTGWSNVNLNISGTNGAPDSSSGGYDGIAARNFLTGSPYNWTITHT